MKILAIVTGEYGRRHVKNIRAYGPDTWQVEVWEAPTAFPLVIDYPEDYLPESLPEADLILSFAEYKGVAELLPDAAKLCGAKAIVAAIDNESWLPRGLARQLRGWCEDIGVVCATPKPLCSLTGSSFHTTLKNKVEFYSPLIAEFARHFGQPDLKITVDPETRTIASAEVITDAVCGCARYVAERLVGISVDEVEEKAGLLHHHYPCLASMVKDPDYNYDTLMHASGNHLKRNIGEQIKPYKTYLEPDNKSE